MDSQIVTGRVKRAARACIFVIGLLLLLGTWYFMYWWVAVVTEGSVAMINHFFAVPPGSILPSVLILAVSVIIFLVAMVRGRQRTWLPLAFAVTNVLFPIGIGFLTAATSQLARLSCEPNNLACLRTRFSLPVVVLAWGLFCWVQARIGTLSIGRRVGGAPGNLDSISDGEQDAPLA